MGRILIAAMLLLTPAPIGSTIYPKIPLTELIDASDLIFVGTLRSREYGWKADESEVFTYLTFGNLDILKGSLEGGATTFTLRHAGGIIPQIVKQEIVGTPQYQVGERVLLFVRGNMEVDMPIVGMRQGSFRVVKDTVTQAELITSDLGSEEVLSFQGSEVRVRPKPHPRPPPEVASPGEEDDPRAKAIRLRIERDGDETARSLQIQSQSEPQPRRDAQIQIRELREHANKRLREGRFRPPRPAKSADIQRPLEP